MSKSNEAKKTKRAFINPVVGMILRHEDGDHLSAPAKITGVDLADGYISVYRPTGRTKRTSIRISNLRHYYVAREEDVPDINFDESDASNARSTLSNEPRPAAAPEPPPPPPPAPAANDTEVTTLAKVFSSTLETVVKQQEEAAKLHREDMASLERRFEQRMDRQSAQFMSMLREIAVDSRKQEPAAPPVAPAPPPAPSEAKDDAHDAALVRRHMAEFEHLVPEFVSKCLVLVDLRDPAQRARALEANEVHKMFVKWCADGKRASETPYEHAFYALLKKIPNAKHREEVKRGDKKRVLTPWAAKDTRQVEMFPDPPSQPSVDAVTSIRLTLDTMAVAKFARENLWASLDQKNTAAITDLLRSGLTAAEMIDALKALVGLVKNGTSNFVYTPEGTLNPTDFAALVAYSRRAK